MNVNSLHIHDLAEDPDRLERAMAEQQQLSRSDPAVRSLLESIYLEPERDSSFERFLNSYELKVILDLFDMFGVDRSAPACEIGGGPGFLAWSMAKSGFADMHLLEPNPHFNTGTGYLRSRPDAASIKVHHDLGAWHASDARFPLIVTKNCIHHFKNIPQAAATIRQKMQADGLWFAFREMFADTPAELYDQIAYHPYCQRYGLYEWAYPAPYYVDSIEIAGFKLKAVVPAGYANNTLGAYSNMPGNADIQSLTTQLDGILRVTPQVTVDAFRQEALQNRNDGGKTKFFTRPQLMVFSVAPI